MGIDSLLQQNMQNAGLAGTDRLAGNAMFPQSQQEHTQFATPTQMPTSAEVIDSDYDAPTNSYTGMPTKPFASGGLASIPRYAGGGLFGQGDQQPADLNSLYQQYLGRAPDASGLATYSGMDPTQVATALQNSQEFKNLHPEGLNNFFVSNAGKTANLAGWNNDPLQNETNFNSDAYMKANPDVAASGMSAWDHYSQYGKNEGRQASFDASPSIDPSRWVQNAYGADSNGEGGKTYYTDPRTGNAYTYSMMANPNDPSGEAGLIIDPNSIKALAGGNALNDKYISLLGLDPSEAQKLYEQKQSNPSQFYSDVGDKLESNYFAGASYNHGDQTLLNAIESLKDVDPAAYYREKIKEEASWSAWDKAQGNGRDVGHLDALKNLISQGKTSGLSPDTINSLVNSSYSDSYRGSKQEMANAASSGGGMFGNAIPAITMIAAMALAPELAPLLVGELGAVGGAAATGAILGGGSGAINAGISGGNIGEGILKGAAIGGVGGGVAGGISDVFSNIPTETTQAMTDYASSTPDPILALTELQNMTPAELSATLGTEVTPSMAEKITSKLASTAAKTELAKMFASSSGDSSAAVARASGSSQGGGGDQGIPGSAGSTSGSNQGIASAANPMFNPATTSGLAIAPTTQAYAPATNPLFLSKLSDFKYDAPTEMAAGGMAYGGGISTLGSYSDGGRLLKGPGDGMSDNIPATIGDKQPARLADGEFVIPADVVSHLGNGSTDAGAKQLYKMMDKIRKARTGNPKQGKQINPDKFTLKG